MSKLTIGLHMFGSHSWMGGRIYVRNLVQILEALPAAERPRIRLIGVSCPLDEDTRKLLGSGVTLNDSLIHKVLRRVNRVGRKLGADRLWATPGIQVTYPAPYVPFIDGAKPINWIPDFQHKHLPEFFSSKELDDRDRGFEAIAQTSGLLVLSSQDALKDFRHWYPQARIVPRVWSFCSLLTASPGPDPRELHSLPKKYLYLPNQFWTHKDHRTAFRALSILKGRRPDCVPTIVCTGFREDYRSAGHFNSVMDEVDREGLRESVRYLGVVSREDQIQIFRHAAAVLQPSLFEGWSTVIEDAKSLGRPIIASDLAVHKEQIGAGGTYFKARSPESLATALDNVWSDLRPGPDLNAETVAADRTRQRIVELGRLFVSIAEEAAQFPCAE